VGKYESGTKSEVARKMMAYAIRDQEALIDAFNTAVQGDDAREAVLDAKKCIRDFKHLYRTICREV